MKVEPYLFFEGCCEEALAFYQKAAGAEILMKLRYKESPVPPQPGKDAKIDGEKIMHASFRIGQTTLMASDGCNQGTPNFQGFSLCITVGSDGEAQKIFTAMSEGGAVRMPLTKTFYSSNFGMLTDRFGMGWMVMVGQ